MSFLRNFIVLLSGRLASLALLFGSRVLLARFLGPAATGAFNVALNSATVSSRWLSLGIAPGVQYAAGRHGDRAATVFRTSLAISVFVGVGVGITVWLASPLLKSLVFANQPEAFAAFAQMVPILPVMIAGMVLTIFLLGRNQCAHYNFIQVIPLFLFAGVLLAGIWLKSRGWPVNALQIAVWAQLVLWLSTLLLALLLARLYWRHGAFDLGLAKEILKFGLRVWPSTFLQFGIARIAIIFGATLIAAKEIGQYVVAVNVAETLLIIGVSAEPLIFNRMSQRSVKANELALFVLRISTGMMLGCAIVVALIGQRFYVFIFGEAYRAGWNLCVILLGSSVAHMLGQLQLHMLSGRGRPELGVLSQAVEFGSLLIFICLLASRFGPIGLAWASVLAAFSGLILTTVMTQRELNCRLMEQFVLRRSDIAYLRRRLLKKG